MIWDNSNSGWRVVKMQKRRISFYPIKLTTTRWRMTWAKMKSANPRSGLIPPKWSLFEGLTWKRPRFNYLNHDLVKLWWSLETFLDILLLLDFAKMVTSGFVFSKLNSGLFQRSLETRDLQHATRIESCRIVCCIDEKHDLSNGIGRIANSSFDTKRKSYICVV